MVRSAKTGEPVPGAKVHAVDWSFYGMVREWKLEADEAWSFVMMYDAAKGGVETLAQAEFELR